MNAFIIIWIAACVLDAFCQLFGPIFKKIILITKLKNGSATEMKELYPELNSRIPSIWTRDSYIVTTGEFKPTDIDEFLKLQKKYESYNIEE